jgi:hypothetical protein
MSPEEYLAQKAALGQCAALGCTAPIALDCQCGLSVCEEHTEECYDCRKAICEGCVMVYELREDVYFLCPECYHET